MPQKDFVPLSYYFDQNNFDFLDIQEDILKKIGTLETKIESDEIVKELGSHDKTFYDNYEEKDVTISLVDVEVERTTKITATFINSQEITIKISGINGLEFVLSSTGVLSNAPYTAIITINDAGLLNFVAGVTFKLRFSNNFLRPMSKEVRNDGKVIFEEDESTESFEVDLGQVEIKADSAGHFSFGIKAGFSINKPVMVGNTGVIIDEFNGISFNLDGAGLKPVKAPFGWKGLYLDSAKVYIPSIMNGYIAAKNLGIGSGGFYGDIIYSGAKIEGDMFGMMGSISSVSLEFLQSIPTDNAIKGELQIPFFDEPVSVDIGIDFEGGFTVKLNSDNGLYKLVKESIIEVDLDSLGFEQQEEVFTAKLSGELKPLLLSNIIDWPSFKVNELSIDSDGNVHLDGGWLDLPKQYSFNFHGFQLEITKLGLGKTEDGGKYIGFSGGLKLVDGLPAGASVEGLRIIWYDDGRDTKITFDGVGVEFEVPDVLRFKGAVSYRDSLGEHRFEGDIKLELLALDLQVDAKLVIGSKNDNNYFAIYLGAELPAGIPLWCTGLAIYGMDGLFALQMEPKKKEEQQWYGINHNKSWYHAPPAIGITDITSNKWHSQPDSMALGAGVTIGTVSDNGYAFSGKMLLMIVFPGPILLIEGRANLLKERTSLDEEALFRALAVLDNRAGTFLVGLDAQYRYDSSGKLISIGGSAEAFFNFYDASAWHLYLGQKEPREKRIQAEILSIFKANSYFMLDAHQVATGAWLGWAERYKFGPLRITAEAWIKGNAAISWKPPHFYGELGLHGKAAVKVFWFDFGLSLDAGIETDVFDPFHILAKLKVGVNLPWFLPDFKVTITLEWGPEPKRAPLPLPLKEIAVEHFKGTSSHPLPRGEFLLPNYDENNDGFRDEPNQTVQPANLNDLPVVPLDCRPHITFSRPIWDDAMVGNNIQPPSPASEQIGDPAKGEGPLKLRYSLQKVRLEKWVRGAQRWDWEPVAWAPNNDYDQTKLYGSWAPVPAMPDGGGKVVAQTKLWLWSKTPFDYTRHSGRTWDEWFTDRFSLYPCLVPPDKKKCYDFEHVDPRGEMVSPWAHPDEKDLIFEWLGPREQHVRLRIPPKPRARNRSVCFPPRVIPSEGTEEKYNSLTIRLPQPAKEVKLLFLDDSGIRETEVNSYAANGSEIGKGVIANRSNIEISVRKSEEMITKLVVVNKEVGFCLLAVCITVGMSDDEINLRQEMETHLQNETVRWEQTGAVLEPHTIYRLKVVTTLEVEGSGLLSGYHEDFPQEEFAYFRTEGPPGLTKLGDGLDDLGLYVNQTFPATVPVQGQKPFLPRPVYRAYDVGVAFNENYVDLMYRISGRDLGLYLYDNNNRPVGDAQGHLIVLSNRWGEAEQISLNKSDVRWITTINTSKCIPSIDLKAIPRNKTLSSADKGQVLNQDTIYEARLIPLLLHDDFSNFSAGTIIAGPSGDLDGWEVHDEGAKSKPSHWEIGKTGNPSCYYINQKSDIWGGQLNPKDAAKLGTYLLRKDDPTLTGNHPEQPSRWTDYRLSVTLRSADDGAIGVVFRYINEENHIFFAMDREGKYRRLVRVIRGRFQILAQDDFVYVQDRDYLITVEAISSMLSVYQDGDLVFRVTDNSLLKGTIGLYCWHNQGAMFSDVRVDDFTENAPIAYRFKFTTSRFANFFNHIHSFQDETWKQELFADTDVKPLLDKAVSLMTKPSEEEASDYQNLEAHDYQNLVKEVFSAKVRQNPTALQVTSIEQNEQILAYLIESPEPLDWKRIELEVLHSDRSFPKPALPGNVKLTDVTFGNIQPNEESVSILLREPTNLTRHRVEYRSFPGPIAESLGNGEMLRDDFNDQEGGLLFSEEFGPNTPDNFIILDDGLEHNPLTWQYKGHVFVSAKKPALVQSHEIYGGPVTGKEWKLLETMLITGSEKWNNVRIRTTIHFKSDGAIGVVFRYQDENNYYRFSVGHSSTGGRYSLSKKCGENFDVLWETGESLELIRSYNVVIEVYDNRLLGYSDNILLFCLEDGDIAFGKVGFFCWDNNSAVFENLEIEGLEADPLLWQPSFSDLGELDIIDEEDAIQGPSDWDVENGMLKQSSNIHVIDNVAQSTIHRPGTYAMGGDSSWEDIEIFVRLCSNDDDAIGVMFCVTPHIDDDGYEIGHNYYRFSMDRQRGYRRLIKKVGDTVKELWSDGVLYTNGQTYELTIRAIGNELCGYLDGVPLFKVYDNDLKHGQVGLYCWANTGACYERVLVIDRTRYVGRCIIKDEGTAKAPSLWRISGGSLLQLFDISGGGYPDYPGTYALAGEKEWTDYRMFVKLRSDDDNVIGIMFRYVDPDNYYRLSVDRHNNRCLLTVKENGVVRKLKEKSRSYAVGKTFTLTVDAIGSRLSCFIGDELLFEVIDTTHSVGKVGLYCWGNNAARFEEVEVRQPPLEAYCLFRDRFTNGSKAGWSFIDEGEELGPSNWEIIEGSLGQTTDIYTPPIDRDTLSKPGANAVTGDKMWSDVIFSARFHSGDDDAIGLLFRYQDAKNYYRFSMDSLRSYRRLVKNKDGEFSLLWEDAFSYTAGQSYELTIIAVGSKLRGYFDGVPMFVVEDEDFRSGRIGLYSWGNHDARFSQVRVYPAKLKYNDWLLDEPFHIIVDDRWTFVDQGDQQGPHQWHIVDGELIQTSNIHGGTVDDDVLNKPGTLALVGDKAWADYRLSVRFRSDDADDAAIGVVFRYQDENNYYRFAMNRERPYRALTKVVDGKESKVASNNESYILRREYILTIECINERLTVYLDGVKVFSEEDTDLSSGCIGLYCWANQGARFKEVRVSAPIWKSFYTFGSEDIMPAGTRVKILAGNAKHIPSEEPRIEQRFAATLDENGQFRLSHDWADLRLVSPEDEPGHARRFIMDEMYEIIKDAKVLRNADGTCFFLMPPLRGTALDAGHYRLRLTYNRDNHELDPDSQVYSQTGNSNPETVRIDIP